MERGEREYGALAFLKNDMLVMLCEELLDVSNYARMEFIKMCILAEARDQVLEGLKHPDMIGSAAFNALGGKD